MPELPEVETVCRGLSNTLLNLNIQKVKVINFNLRYRIPLQLEKKLFNEKIKAVIRRGKNGFLILNNNKIIIFHLGMTGKFKIEKAEYKKQKHDHLLIEFKKNIKLIYNDVRKFGYILCVESPLDIFHFNKMGKEPFLALFFIDDLYYDIKRRKASIKHILLDQSFIAGIGNIYASEILFNCNIYPFKKARNISKKSFKKLLTAVEKILQKAILKGGVTIKDYRNVSGDLGYFQLNLKVYGREGLSCYKCKSLIIKSTRNGRSTFYCKNCQSR